MVMAAFLSLCILVHSVAGAAVNSAEPRGHIFPDRLELSAVSAAPGSAGSGKSAQHNHLDDVEKDFLRTQRRLRKVDANELSEAAGKDFGKLYDLYLGTLDFKPFYFTITLAVFIPSMLWLAFYFNYIFTADRRRHHLQTVGHASRNNVGDVAIVFDHPIKGRTVEADKEIKVTLGSFEPFNQDDLNKGDSQLFPSVQKLREEVRLAEEEHKAESNQNHLQAALTGTLTGSHKHDVSLYDLKVAVLQDLVEVLERMHCEVQVYTSIDQDEVYLCATILDEEALTQHLIHNDTPIQIHSDLISKLGIKYPDEIADCDEVFYSPPHVRFDPDGLVKRLFKAEVIDAEDPALVYQTNKHAKSASFVGGTERLRIIYKKVTRHFDMDAAVEKQLMLAWFPLHNQNRSQKMHEAWGSFAHLRSWSFMQPVAEINHYLGARVAFATAWNGLYAKALLGLAPVAIVVSISSFIFWFLGITWVVSSNPLGVGFSLCLAVWSRIAVNLWQQEQNFLCHDFNMTSEGSMILPTFRGEVRPSPVDLNQTEKYFSPVYATGWRCFSAAVIALFALVVFATTYMWDYLFDGKVTLTGSVFLAIQIKIFEFLFHMAAVYLTDCENHKFQRAYYDSFLWKKFTFYAVNSYYPFFYLVVMQGAVKGSCPGDCVVLLRHKLFMTMTILTVLRIVQVVVATTLLDVFMWLERRQLKKDLEAEKGHPVLWEELPEASQEERQAKSGDYKTNEQVEVMLQLVLSLGFVLLFAASAPIILVLCMLLFAVNIRATGTLLLTAVRRPFPHRACGIGAWQGVINALMMVGIITNGFFLVQFGGAFKKTPIITKVTGASLFVLLCVLLWKAVDVLVPKVCLKVDILVKRREHVVAKMSHLLPKKKKEKDGPKKKGTGDIEGRRRSEIMTNSLDSVRQGKWMNISFFPGAKQSQTSARGDDWEKVDEKNP